MATFSLTFAPPHQGFEGEFNTLRMGKLWATRLQKGDMVAITDSKTGEVVKWAEVTEVHIDRLPNILRDHAHRNHKETTLNDPAGAAQRRRESMMKLYGPRTVVDSRWASAIYLRVRDVRLQIQPDCDGQG